MSDEYNVKLIEYLDSAEIRVYSENIRKRKRKSKKCNEIDNMLRWFGAKLVREETQKQREQRELLNLYNAVNRARKRILGLASSNEWDMFITLTYATVDSFNGNPIDRTDFKACMAKVRSCMKSIKKIVPTFRFLIVPELHKDKCSWHIHGLIHGLLTCEKDIKDMLLIDSGKTYINGQAYDRIGLYKDFPPIYSLGLWQRYGFSSAIVLQGNGKQISRYITKYICKESCALTKGCHRYFSSKGLKSPKQTNYNVPVAQQEAFLDYVCNKGNLEVVYSKKTSKYIDTTHYMLEEKATD